MFRDDERLDLRYIFEGHALGVVSVDINNEGNVAASNSLDSHIRLWDLDSGNQVQSIDGGPVNAWTVNFSPDSKLIATATHSGRIILYGVGSGNKFEKPLDSTGKFTLSLAFVRFICFQLIIIYMLIRREFSCSHFYIV